MDLLTFLQGGATRASSNSGDLEKIAERVVQKEKEMRKLASETTARGRFMGSGFVKGMLQKVAEDLSNTGVDSVNPISAAVRPELPGIELPTNAPGPDDVLRTVRPGGGEQHNNDLYMKKIEENRLKEGLADIHNQGISSITGSPFGTGAQFGLDHNQGNQGSSLT